MVVQKLSAIPIFCLYTQKDKVHLEDLKSHLSALLRQNLASFWHKGDISAGKEWEQESKKYLDAAKIILLLISPEFIKSDYCYDKVQYLLKRYEQGKARIIPVLLRPTHDWESVGCGKIQLGNFEPLPSDGKSVTEWVNLDKAWYNVTEGIKKVVDELRGESPPSSGEWDGNLPKEEPPLASEQESDSSLKSDGNNSMQTPNPPGPVVVHGGDSSQTLSEGLKKHLVSRRTIIRGGLVIGAGVAIGGVFLIQSHGAKAPSSSIITGPKQVVSVTANPTPSASATSPTTPTPPIGQPLNIYPGHTNIVRSVAWFSDGRVVSGGDDGTVQVWMWKAQKASFSYYNENNNTHYIVYAVACSPDKRYIATANSDWRVRIWDTHSSGTGPVVTHVVTPPTIKTGTNAGTNELYAVAWSPDGKYIAYGGRDMIIHIRRWQDSTADVLTYGEHTGQVYTIAWSPDGKSIASAGTDRMVRVWNPLNGAFIYSYSHDHNVYAVAWSPDGLLLASGSNDTSDNNSNTLQVWNINLKQSQLQYPQGLGTIYSLMWSPKNNGQFAWSGAKGVVQVWDNLGSKISSFKGLTKGVLSVAWSSDGESIAAGGYNTSVFIWRAN